MSFTERSRSVLKRLPDNAVVAEVGVSKGRMSKALGACKLYMIDAWSADYSDCYRETGDLHSLLTQKQQDRNFELAQDSAEGLDRIIVRQRSCETDFPNEFFDLVFIDADHSYEGCKSDILHYLPTVKKGGYIGGHDYDFPGVKKAVDELFPAIEQDEDNTWFVRF